MNTYQPHDIARIRYETARMVERAGRETREERGLPHHPDGTGYATCPDCQGAGEHIVNDTDPHGYGPDPQRDEEVECPRCRGEGEIEDGHADPILLLRRYRRERLTRRPLASYFYGAVLQRVITPATLPEDL